MRAIPTFSNPGRAPHCQGTSHPIAGGSRGALTIRTACLALVTPEAAFPDQLTLYCDESGNSGSNYLDPDQPLHVLAGWLVPAKSAAALEAAVAKMRRCYPQAKELHALKAIKSPKGREGAAELASALLDAGCLPTYIVAEKRYCVGAKIVETYFDPMHNEAARWLPTTAFEARRTLAQGFADLPLPILAEFVAAYRAPEASAFARNIEAIAVESDRRGGALLARTLRAQHDSVAELASIEATAGPEFSHAAMVSLNFPIFCRFVNLVDEFVAETGGGKVHVVHDETREFEAAFRYMFKAFATARSSYLPILGPNGRPMRFGLDHLERFTTTESSKSAGVQAADVLAASVRHLLATRLRGDQWDASMRRLCYRTLTPLLFPEPRVADILAGDLGLRVMLRPVLEVARDAATAGPRAGRRAAASASSPA